MKYIGKLYGNIGGRKYFDTGKTSADFDQIETLKAEVERLRTNISYALAGLDAIRKGEPQCNPDVMADEAYKLATNGLTLPINSPNGREGL
jgi:hypothetical protein